MNRIITTLLSGILLSGLLTAPVRASDGIRVSDAWIREAPPGSPVLAGYLTLGNNGSSSVYLTGVSSQNFGSAEIHLSRVENGIARMQAVEQLEIPAGQSVQLQPGSYHLMLFDPVRPLRSGDNVRLLLHFEDQECLSVTAPVSREPLPAVRH